MRSLSRFCLSAETAALHTSAEPTYSTALYNKRSAEITYTPKCKPECWKHNPLSVMCTLWADCAARPITRTGRELRTWQCNSRFQNYMKDLWPCVISCCVIVLFLFAASRWPWTWSIICPHKGYYRYPGLFHYLDMEQAIIPVVYGRCFYSQPVQESRIHFLASLAASCSAAGQG